jgi:hypothetical protein
VVLDSVGDGESPKEVTFPLTVAPGTNRALAVFVHFGGICGTPDPIAAVSFAGTPLVQVVTRSPTGCNGVRSDLWALPAGVEPPVGTNDVQVVISGGVNVRRRLQTGAIAANGVDQTTTFTSFATNDGNSTTASVALPSSGSSDLVIHSACARDGVTSTADLSAWNFAGGSPLLGCDNSGGATAVGGTTAPSWSIVNGPWVMLGASFKAAAASTATVNATAAQDGAAVLRYPMTVGVGANGALAVFVHIGTGCGVPQPAVSTVTYAGVALNRVLTRPSLSCGGATSMLWALPLGTAPTSGTHDVVVSLSGPMREGSLHSGAVSAFNVDPTTTFSAVAASDGNGMDASVALGASGASDLVIHSVCNGHFIVGTSQTELWKRNLSSDTSCDNSAGGTAPGGTTNISWTMTDDFWTLIVAAFKFAAPVDGGADAGFDGGLAETDAGVDAGTDAGSDAGAGGSDAGTGGVLRSGVGCGCMQSAWSAVLLPVLVLRRRSRFESKG